MRPHILQQIQPVLKEMWPPDADGEGATVVEPKLPLACWLVSEDTHLMTEPSDAGCGGGGRGKWLNNILWMKCNAYTVHTVNEQTGHTVNTDAADTAYTHSSIQCIAVLLRNCPPTELATQCIYVYKHYTYKLHTLYTHSPNRTGNTVYIRTYVYTHYVGCIYTVYTHSSIQWGVLLRHYSPTELAMCKNYTVYMYVLILCLRTYSMVTDVVRRGS